MSDDGTEARLAGEVRVASRIVDYLSSGLYKSPAACLKELVNNSFDADAENVYLYVKPSANTVTIEDDGVGLAPESTEPVGRHGRQPHGWVGGSPIAHEAARLNDRSPSSEAPTAQGCPRANDPAIRSSPLLTIVLRLFGRVNRTSWPCLKS